MTEGMHEEPKEITPEILRLEIEQCQAALEAEFTASKEFDSLLKMHTTTLNQIMGHLENLNILEQSGTNELETIRNWRAVFEAQMDAMLENRALFLRHMEQKTANLSALDERLRALITHLAFIESGKKPQA